MHNDESIGIPDAMSAAAEDLELAQTSRESDQILKSDVEIAYQNKDISSKLFTERLRGKSFGVYGMELPEVEEVLPTNIPIIKVNELRLDNLLGLADGSVAVVDYESEYKKDSKVKYLNYLTGVVNRYESEKKMCPNLRMIVIYTGDIKREEVTESYDVGAVRLVIEPAFLSEVDGDEIFRRLKEKVESGDPLSDEEQMEFCIFPLTYRKKEEKVERIREAVRLAARIADREQQIFVLAGIMTFTDKVIDEETADQIRKVIGMTKIEMIFEKEKQEAVMEERRKTEEERKKKEEAEKRLKEERKKAERRLKEERKKAEKRSEEERKKAEKRSEEERKKAEKRSEEERGKILKEQMEEKKKSAIEMLRDELPVAKIVRYSGLDMATVTELAESIL